MSEPMTDARPQSLTPLQARDVLTELVGARWQDWSDEAVGAAVTVVGLMRDRHLAEIDRQAAEIAAFRQAIKVGDGPSCEDVCQRECIGVCGV